MKIPTPVPGRVLASVCLFHGIHRATVGFRVVEGQVVRTGPWSWGVRSVEVAVPIVSGCTVECGFRLRWLEREDLSSCECWPIDPDLRQ